MKLTGTCIFFFLFECWVGLPSVGQTKCVCLPSVALSPSRMPLLPCLLSFAVHIDPVSASLKWQRPCIWHLVGGGFCPSEPRQAAILNTKFHSFLLILCNLLSFQERQALCLWTPREKGTWITHSMTCRKLETSPFFFLLLHYDSSQKVIRYCRMFLQV